MRSVEPPETSTTGGPSPSRSKAMAVPSRERHRVHAVPPWALPGRSRRRSSEWSERTAGSRHPSGFSCIRDRGGRPGPPGSAARAGWSCAGRPPGSAARAAGRVAGHLQQVGAHGVEPVVAGHPLVGVERRPAGRARPAGPRTIATATAWFSVTIGLGASRSSSSYRARICGQSVSSARRPPRRARRRSPPAAGRARAAPWASASVTSATPSSIGGRGPSGRGPARRAAPARRRRRCGPAGGRRSAASARAARPPRRRPAAAGAPRG